MMKDEETFINNNKFRKEFFKLVLWLESEGSYKEDNLKHIDDQYEHVLPESFKKNWKSYLNWKEIDDDVIENKYVEQVGNFIVLNEKLNNPLSNNSWKEKSKAYKDTNSSKTFYFAYKLADNDSDLLNTIGIEEYTDWTPETIEERTKKILKTVYEKINKKFNF